jgi:hypothetical protein
MKNKKVFVQTVKYNTHTKKIDLKEIKGDIITNKKSFAYKRVKSRMREIFKYGSVRGIMQLQIIN